VLAQLARQTDDVTRGTALALLEAAPPDPALTYQRALLRWWSGDQAGAIALHRQAADQADPDACFELYVLHANGQGVDRDPDQARAWLLRAAELGQMRALYNLGALHATGSQGFPLDLTKSVMWYARAAEAGHAKAATTLATMLLVGTEVPADPVAAGRWLSVAESLGVDVDELLADLGVDDPRA
jgi:hypothetical protein